MYCVQNIAMYKKSLVSCHAREWEDDDDFIHDSSLMAYSIPLLSHIYMLPSRSHPQKRQEKRAVSNFFVNWIGVDRLKMLCYLFADFISMKKAFHTLHIFCKLYNLSAQTNTFSFRLVAACIVISCIIKHIIFSR